MSRKYKSQPADIAAISACAVRPRADAERLNIKEKCQVNTSFNLRTIALTASFALLQGCGGEGGDNGGGGRDAPGVSTQRTTQAASSIAAHGASARAPVRMDANDVEKRAVASAATLMSSSADADVTIGPLKRLRAVAREPQGSTFSNGRVIVAGKKTTDGVNWSDVAGSPFSDSGIHRSVTLSGGQVVLYSGAQMIWDTSVLKWRQEYQQAADIEATTRVPSTNYVTTFPGDSNWHWETHQAFKHDNQIYLTVKRRVTRTTVWRGSTVAGTFYESHLVKSAPGAYTSFLYVGRIAGQSEFASAASAAQKSAFLSERLPVYEADNPRCISVSSTRIVCAMRTSADDDDGMRKLDPAKIFHAWGSTLSDTYNTVKGGEVHASVYFPVLEDIVYKAGTADIPPLLIAISDDSGATWTRKFIADRGGIDSSFAYDSERNTLVIAYSGLSYPRKGVAIQYSTDHGDTWSAPINVSEEEGFTEGLPFIASVGGGKFSLVYATSDKYFGPNNQIERWNINQRLVTIVR